MHPTQKATRLISHVMNYESSILKRLFPVLIILLLVLCTTPAFCKTVTFTKEYAYQASEFDSKASSRILALAQLKRNLLEEIGTYLISDTDVKNFKLRKDQITVLTAGIVQANILDEKWDGKTYWIKAQISADPKNVVKSINELKDDYSRRMNIENMQQILNDALMEAGSINNKEQYDSVIKTVMVSNLIDDGIVRIHRADYSGAILVLSQAIQMDQNSAWAFYNRGVALVNINNLESALSDFDKAIEIDQKHALAFNNRGFLFALRGEDDKAVRDFDKAIEIYPGLAITYYNRGNYYSGRQNYSEALKDYNTALKLDPNNATIYYNRGNLYSSMNLLDKSIQDYNAAIHLNSKLTFAYGNRGLAYGKQGNYKQAIKDFSKAIELNPDSGNDYFNRGIAYHKMNKKNDAFRDYKTAARLGNEDAINFLKTKGVKW